MTQPTWKFTPINVSEKVTFYKITTKELTDLLSKEINEYWKDEQRDNVIRFPGSQPVSIEKRSFSQLKKEPYVVCAKLDGERYMLYLTEIPADLSKPDGNKLKVAFMVNRRLDFFIITQQFSDDSYKKKTLLDGELIKNKFIIHESISLAGNVVKTKKWEERWRPTDIFLQKHYKMQENETLRISLKKFYHFKNISHLFKEIEEKQIKSDGIVFYPMNDPVQYRTQNNLFKWKPPGHHTVDFKINVENDNVELITWGRGEPIVFETMNKNPFLQVGINPKTDQVIEFKGTKGNFIPLIIRKDKPVGNNLYTVRKTLLNIRENITKENLINVSK